MGFSILWCAVREEKAENFLHKLKLSPTGETEEFPDSLISVGQLNTGWRLLWYNKYDCPFLSRKTLAELSVDFEIVLCQVEEHVMASSAEFWAAGKRQWRIFHEGERGPEAGVMAEGKPPESYSAVKQEMEGRQREQPGKSGWIVDYMFDVPLKVAQQLVGFKHDERCDALVGDFVVMARAASEGGFFRRFFGKK